MSVVEVIKALEVSQETIKQVNEEIRVLEKLEDENYVLCRLHRTILCFLKSTKRLVLS